jgi:hypothetical protein
MALAVFVGRVRRHPTKAGYGVLYALIILAM